MTMATHALPKMCLRRCTAVTATSSPTARTFFQLARHRGSSATSPTLDFLLPSIPSASPNSLLRATPRSIPQLSYSRAFTASSLRQDTTAIYNPRKDDDGNDMLIGITPRAVTRLTQIRDRDQNPRIGLRITVESGGCHGFQYGMTLINVPPIDAATQKPVAAATGEAAAAAAGEVPEHVLDEEDTVFESDEGAKVVMDLATLELLKGSNVDFTTELIGSQFKIADNPKASSSCGCGTSFDVKE